MRAALLAALFAAMARAGREGYRTPVLHEDREHPVPVFEAPDAADAPFLAPNPATASGSEGSEGSEGTSRRRLSLSRIDLSAWQVGYDALGGSAWTHCADARDDPCGRCTYATRVKRGGRFVHCSGGRITHVSLFSNNAQGILPRSSQQCGPGRTDCPSLCHLQIDAVSAGRLPT